MPIINLNTISDLPNAAKEFLPVLENNKILAFFGNMGVGKTTFIKELCSTMGVKTKVTSPTFAIVNEYESALYGLIYHFDFYRIEKQTEIFDIGFDEYLESGAYVFIEWPDKLGTLLPTEALSVLIKSNENEERTIIF